MSSNPRRGGSSSRGGLGSGNQSFTPSRGGGGSSSGGRRPRGNQQSNRRQNNGNRQQNRSRPSGDDALPSMSDEEVLIAFMPYLRKNNPEASRIHEELQRGSNQQSFLKEARMFLERERANPTVIATDNTQSSPPLPATNSNVINPPSPSISATSPPNHHLPPQVSNAPFPSDPMLGHRRIDPQTLFPQASNNGASMASPLPTTPQGTAFLGHVRQNSGTAVQQHEESFLAMSSINQGLDSILSDDPIVPTPGLSSIWGAPSPSANSQPANGHTITPPRAPVPEMYPQSNNTSAVATSPQSPWLYNNGTGIPVGAPVPTPQAATSNASATPITSSPAAAMSTSSVVVVPDGSSPSNNNASPHVGSPPEVSSTPILLPQKTPKKEAPPPKRIWTKCDEQPGKILVNGFPGDDPSIVVNFAPRDELTAHWILSLGYLRNRAELKHGPNVSLEKVLSTLTLGLFRRGCTENGQQASIISKGVLGDYWKDPATDTVRGKVPFYSPRTPGHVVFRLYWDDDPVYTLATGPGILVRVLEPDFESSVRFILSNFRGKKSNPTSLSSLHSLATVLETKVTRPNESSARATWGCVQEARKVLEACANEYEKTTSKLAVLEESVEELKKQVEAEETKSHGSHVSIEDDDNNSQSEAAISLKEKTRSLMSGRASCERKWRDSQLAFASILRAIVHNPSLQVVLRRDLIVRMRIEYELWCPLSEEFALLSDDLHMWYEPLRNLPSNVSPEDFQQYTEARKKMQQRTLGFDPNTSSLEDVLFPRNPATPSQRSMDPGAVGVFNRVSGAMGNYFQKMFAGEDVVVRRREMIRQRTEKCVQECGAFPPGTRVAIFGSSANGFGSPKSDLDMCLQLPDGSSLGDGDSSGSESMAKLATFFESSGMTEVDTARLTARIPIIMYHCPNPLPEGQDSPEFIECDLSMHNPLAVYNTGLLRAYAEITPVTRVLASIIKRWAKARDINNPSRHTLSSYGYILMVLHFLTYHKRTGNGLVSPAAPPEGDPMHRNPSSPRPLPLLPNLQWMDPMWPNLPRGTPYREYSALPKRMMNHPIEKEKKVNTYFFQPNSPNDRAALQVLFPGQDLSLAILLASFFRYYAYEFDYKRYVVSLHSTSARGLVEREVKAELDGWRNYSAALTIEDPFETFYDVAHVLRGGYYHRIRREFAVAYTKIADVASGRQGSWNKGDLREMSGEDIVDWICEPIEKERSDST